jgi:hypothetical protein
MTQKVLRRRATRVDSWQQCVLARCEFPTLETPPGGRAGQLAADANTSAACRRLTRRAAKARETPDITPSEPGKDRVEGTTWDNANEFIDVVWRCPNRGRGCRDHCACTVCAYGAGAPRSRSPPQTAIGSSSIPIPRSSRTTASRCTSRGAPQGAGPEATIRTASNGQDPFTEGS